MAIHDIFSKRQKRLRGGEPDVYQYDIIPAKLRNQIVQIMSSSIGGFSTSGHPYVDYKTIVDILCREYGRSYLTPTGGVPYAVLSNFILESSTTEECLDAVELVASAIDKRVRVRSFAITGHGEKLASSSLEEINIRFRESGVGYQFIDGEIIRVDSELIHAKAVKPALSLLNTKGYAGPHEEFLGAYQHFRMGSNKEALTDCLKAFESTMKAICDKRGWAYDPAKDTAKKLIDILFDNGLIPQFWQTQFTSLRSLLESSVPTGRNKLSGHGQGATPTTVPDYLTAYMLHMTASTLVFLTTAEKELP